MLGGDLPRSIDSSGRIAFHALCSIDEGKDLRLVTLGVYCLTAANL